MPQTPQQKAEKRARAAFEAGKLYEARTAANQAIVASIKEEEPRQLEEAQQLDSLDAPDEAPLVKQQKKAPFAFPEARYEDPYLVSLERLEVQDHLVGLAAAHCQMKLPEKYSSCTQFGNAVIRYYKETICTQFRLVEKETLAPQASHAPQFALEEMERARQQAEEKRQECLRLQAEKEQRDQVQLTAKYAAIDALHPLNKSCEDCRLARKRAGPRHCELHEVMYQALFAHHLKNAQSKSEVSVEPSKQK